MKVIIDGRMIDEEMHGIARYAYEIIKKIQFYEDLDLYVLVNDINFAKELFGRSDKIKFIKMKSKFLSIGEQIELCFILNKFGKDSIFHSPSFVSSPFIKCKSIMTIHDLNHLELPQYYSKFHKYYYNYIVKPSALKADRVLTVSQFSKNEIVQWLKCDPCHVEVTYNGVDEKFKVIDSIKLKNEVKEKYGLPEKFILYVGNLKPHKNVPNLIRAMKYIDQQYTLVINGKGNDDLNKVIEENNLKSRVCFIGYITDEDLPVIYNLTEAFVFPSIYEGFGLPPLEAMACGCPVVAANSSSIPEVVRDCGILVDVKNPKEIGNAVNGVLHNDKIKVSIINKGIVRSKEFNWRTTTEKTLEIYRRVAGLD